MKPFSTSTFDLPARLAAKSDPVLIAEDESHFAAIADTITHTLTDLTGRLAAARTQRSGKGQVQEALERDLEIHRLSARLRTLRRFSLDLCLGRTVQPDGTTIYIGRLGLADRDGRQLLVDWRSPGAEPFFGATHADPMGLTSRRRYRWTQGRIRDYWDEVFSLEAVDGHVALDDQSAFIASLGSSRSARMRDVLGTIQADQDAIIRAGSSGALVVDGGPGTGKTVVALHRTAYLLYSDPRLGHRRGGVLFVGPHQPYLAYVADVLPSLGEEGVLTCTLRDLVAEGAAAVPEPDPTVAALKASVRMVSAIEPAVRFYEEPPTAGMTVETPWCDLRVTARDWAEAFDAADPGGRHNESREAIWQDLVRILTEKARKAGEDIPAQEFTDFLDRHRALRAALHAAWPLVEAAQLVADLWSVPAYLRHCAPWLTPEQAQALRRTGEQAWTVPDLPLLDAARQRLGDPEHDGRQRRAAAAGAAGRRLMADVVNDAIEADDDDMQVMRMLRGEDLRTALVDPGALPSVEHDPLAGQFAHIVVDEAQELTDAEWQMLRQRCPSGSFTVVGDRAQARHGFTENWQDRLGRVGLDRIGLAALSINYRTPEEIMAAAEPVIRAALPDANVPTSVRSNGIPVAHGAVTDLGAVIESWLAENEDGIACVIGSPTFEALPRVQSLTPESAKGLEFDLVVIVEPDHFGPGIEGAVDRYVAMTRATRRLVILTTG